MAQVRIARSQVIFLLERTRCVIRSELIEANIDALKINHARRKAVGHYTINSSLYQEIIGDFAIRAREGPCLAWSIAGLLVRVLRKYQLAAARHARQTQQGQQSNKQKYELH